MIRDRSALDRRSRCSNARTADISAAGASWASGETNHLIHCADKEIGHG
jgi:hypothetical protein